MYITAIVFSAALIYKYYLLYGVPEMETAGKIVMVATSLLFSGQLLYAVVRYDQQHFGVLREFKTRLFIGTLIAIIWLGWTLWAMFVPELPSP